MFLLFSIRNLLPEDKDCVTTFARTSSSALPSINHLKTRSPARFESLNDQLKQYYQLSTDILSTKKNTINCQLTYYQLKKILSTNLLSTKKPPPPIPIPHPNWNEHRQFLGNK